MRSIAAARRLARRNWRAGLVGLLLGCVGGAAAQDGDAIAIVNGQPISRRMMTEKLLEAHGLDMLQQLIVLELAKDEARRAELKITPGDVDAEVTRALARIAPQSDAGGKALSEEEKQRAVEMLLQQKGLTFTEFRLGMERNAYLRKVIEQRLKVDEATLREEYARLYGEKVEIRHIQLGDINGLHEALDRLNKGADFAEVAKGLSQNEQSAGNGGLLPPFAFNDDEIAPVIREAAFAMKPGEVSKPIQVGRWWHIIRLERRLPSQQAKFEDVRADVERALKDRVITREMNTLITTLFKKAQIRVLDPDLKQKYEKIVKESAIVEPKS